MTLEETLAGAGSGGGPKDAREFAARGSRGSGLPRPRGAPV